MNMEFIANKKIYIIVITFISFVSYFAVYSIIGKGFSLLTFIITICLLIVMAIIPPFNQLKYEINSKLVLSNDSIEMIRNKENSNLFLWSDINGVEFHGIKMFPLFDSMEVVSNGYKIHIDSTTKGYKEAWRLIIEFVEKNSPKAFVDKRFENKLK